MKRGLEPPLARRARWLADQDSDDAGLVPVLDHGVGDRDAEVRPSRSRAAGEDRVLPVAHQLAPEVASSIWVAPSRTATGAGSDGVGLLHESCSQRATEWDVTHTVVIELPSLQALTDLLLSRTVTHAAADNDNGGPITTTRRFTNNPPSRTKRSPINSSTSCSTGRTPNPSSSR